MLVHGVKGGVWDRSSHPQHCQHHPQDADDAGEWGDHTIGGGGGTWPRGLVHIYIYIYIYVSADGGRIFFVGGGGGQATRMAKWELMAQEMRHSLGSKLEELRHGGIGGTEGTATALLWAPAGGLGHPAVLEGEIQTKGTPRRC